MTAMKSMKMTAAEKKADTHVDTSTDWEHPGSDGIEIRIEPHHAEKLGLNGPLPVGHQVELHCKGEVTESHATGSGHRLTVRLHHASAEHDAPTAGSLRDEIKATTDASEAKKADASSARTVARARTDKEIPETKG